MKTILTILLFFAVVLPSNAQKNDSIGFDVDFINNSEKKQMSNYYALRTKQNTQVKSRKNRVFCYDSVTEHVQEINVKDIYHASQYEMQNSIVALDEDGTEHHLTPDSIVGFATKGDYYLRKTITFRGEKKTLFLLREDVYEEEDVRLYSYEDENSLKTYYYVEFADSKELQLMSDDNSEASINRIKGIFLNNPNAKDEMTKKMIANMKPTTTDIRTVYRALKAGGYGHLQRFRWGFEAVGGISKVNADGYDLNSKMLATLGLFAEIPIASKVSIVPELFFTKVSVKGNLKDVGKLPSSAVYNRTEISIPVMVRYTLLSVHGNFIPYIQAGIAPNYGLKQNLDYRLVVEEAKSSFDVNSYVVEESEDIPAFQASAVAGIGAECLVGRKYSFFFELRGAMGLSRFGRNDIMLVAGIKL